MSLYRCAICGSQQVVMDKKKDGFSVSKAVVGTVILGPVGAVAGVNAKETGMYHCGACGQTLSYPMAETTKNSIDRYLADPEKNTDLLKRLKNKYPNIEWNEKANILEGENPKKGILDESNLVDAVWNFYLKNQIQYVSVRTLGEEIFKTDYQKADKVLEILEKRGVLVIEQINNANYCTFYSDAEKIKENLYKLQSMTEDEKRLAQNIRLSCVKELHSIQREKVHDELQKSKNSDEVIRKAVLEELSDGKQKTIPELINSIPESYECSFQKMSAILKRLSDVKAVERVIKGNISFFSITESQLRKLGRKEICIENEDDIEIIRKATLDALAGDIEKSTRDLIYELLESYECTFINMGRVLKTLADRQIIERYEKDNVSYFSLIGARQRREAQEQKIILENIGCLEKELNSISCKLEEVENSKKEKETQLGTLGIFAGKEKKLLREEIDKLEQMKRNLGNKKSSIEYDLEKLRRKIKRS